VLDGGADCVQTPSLLCLFTSHIFVCYRYERSEGGLQTEENMKWMNEFGRPGKTVINTMSEFHNTFKANFHKDNPTNVSTLKSENNDILHRD
jgi:hypothetical protein